MTGTNPGAWPDDWHGDVDDGKRKAFAELDKTIPLYTAAEMKAARLETVERVVKLVAETDYIPGAYQWDKFGEEIEKLKEEINAS